MYILEEFINNKFSKNKKYIVFVTILIVISFIVSLVLKTVKIILYAIILALVVFAGLKIYE